MKTKIIEIHPEFPEADRIAQAAKVIRQGGLVIFPTETVYGIAADYSNPQAMQRLKSVKQRSNNKPFSLMISQKGLISNYTSTTDPVLYKLIDEFWPGPVTFVVPSRQDGETIGIRMPDHLIALKIVEEAQCAIAAPSANKEGNPPPATCQEALADLDGLVDLAVDGGEARFKMGSSVVDLTNGRLEILREGVITQKDLLSVASKKTILFVCTGNSCRSVMAEYLLRQNLRDREDIEVISAGTSVFMHSTASSETISVLREQGIDATRHISQPIHSVLLKKADLIFVMTRAHRIQVLERVPSVEKRIYLLREFANIPANYEGDLDIPDPIGRSHSDYQECMNIIKEAVIKIKELL